MPYIALKTDGTMTAYKKKYLGCLTPIRLQLGIGCSIR